MKKQILIVDDESDILELLEYHFSNAGFDVIGFLNTKHIRDVLAEENIDLIIMDRNLPDIEGSYYIEMLRSRNIEIPVILLSSKNSTEDIKEGLIKGADDYVCKPFDMEELILRCKAILKRSQQGFVENIKYKDIELDLNMHHVHIGKKIVSLTNLETQLLYVLIANRGKVLDREFLLKQVWKEEHSIHLKTVNATIKRLKEKIDPTKEKEYIKTIYGVGYLIL
ncbi:response regulator transcription factor [Sulfurimonas sp.]|uniref:response regulator transcription factor n=1 Tax=Sulfurimonas sp. TaxID=2022749 RepID=UPI00262AB938|nr:response regulator transcription factor [Sulfurimonas sp.]